MSGRLGRLLLSRANLIGTIGAPAAGVVAALGVLGPWWPLAVGGAYAAGALAAPGRAGTASTCGGSGRLVTCGRRWTRRSRSAGPHRGRVLARVIDIRRVDPGGRRRTVRTRRGKTAHRELLDQLDLRDLLDYRLDQIVADAGAGRLAEIVEHGEFLQTRFADPLTW